MGTYTAGGATSNGLGDVAGLGAAMSADGGMAIRNDDVMAAS
jgi:hypothetical protein